MNSVLRIILLLAFAGSLVSCSAPAIPTVVPASTAPAAAKTALTVFAPAALTDASKQLGSTFEATNAGLSAAFEIGHSPTQRAQLEQGAVADVFISASRQDMDAAAEKKLVRADQVKVFARNQLVVVLPEKNPANIQTLADLAKPGVKLLIAAPDIPVGAATATLFDKLNANLAPGFKEKAMANVVSKELGVKPIVSKVSLNEADAGIVYITDAVSAPSLKTLAIPDNSNPTVVFTIAPLAASKNPDQAAAFVGHVMSPEGQALLKKQGFLPGTP